MARQAVDAHLVEDERAAVVQLGEDVRWLRTLHCEQTVLSHRVHDDDALALVIPTNLVLGAVREEMPQFG